MKHPHSELRATRIKSAFACLILVLCIPVFPRNIWGVAVSQTASSEVSLKPGKPLDGSFRGSSPNVYRAQVSAGEYVKIAVSNLRVATEVRLLSPSGKSVFRMAEHSGELEKIVISAITTESGEFRLVLTPLKVSPPTSYGVAIEEQRIAIESDPDRVAAERATMQADQLSAVRTADARRSAITYYQRSLPLWKRLRERDQEAATLTKLGELYEISNEQQRALSLFQRANLVWTTIGDTREAAMTLNKIGLTYNRLDQNLNALDTFQLSLSLWRKLGDSSGAAYTFQNLGRTYVDFNDKQKALDHYEQALKLWQEIKNQRGSAFTLTAIGDIYRSSSDYVSALDYYEQAAAIWRDENDAFGRSYINLKRHFFGGAAGYGRAAGTASRVEDRAANNNVASAAAEIPGSDYLAKDPELWAQIESLNDPLASRTYLRLYPEGRFAERARAQGKNGGRQNTQGNFIADFYERPAYYGYDLPTSVERYPKIESPDPVVAENEFSVLVTLNELQGQKAESVRLPESAKAGWDIEVVLLAPDFVLPEGNNATLFLPRNGNSSPARFKIRSKAIQQDRQLSKLHVTLWHNNTYVGKMVHDVTVVRSAESSKPRTTVAPVFSDEEKAAQPRPATLNLEQGDADLTLLICKSANSRQLEMHTLSKYLPKTNPTRFEVSDLSDWLGVQYNKLFQMSDELAELNAEPNNAARSEAAKRARDFMRGFGRQLYLEFAPPAFKKAFWELSRRLGPSFKTIQIYSSDFALPWELMVPGDPGGVERGFLGSEFAIGRWHLSESASELTIPPQSLSIKNLIVIAPAYKGVKALPNREREIAALGLIGGYQRWPGQLSDAKRLFQEFPPGLIYFSGHGTVISPKPKVSEYSIEFEDGPLDLMTWRGMINRGSQNHPLLFFNACEIGQTQRIANFVDGWAPAVLEAGASAYIGALWPVSDHGAAEFGVNFYEALGRKLKVGPALVAETLMETRKKFLENGDPTFMSYVYFGDANLKLGAEALKK